MRLGTKNVDPLSTLRILSRIGKHCEYVSYRAIMFDSSLYDPLSVRENEAIMCQHEAVHFVDDSV